MCVCVCGVVTLVTKINVGTQTDSNKLNAPFNAAPVSVLYCTVTAVSDA